MIVCAPSSVVNTAAAQSGAPVMIERYAGPAGLPVAPNISTSTPRPRVAVGDERQDVVLGEQPDQGQADPAPESGTMFMPRAGGAGGTARTRPPA